MLWRDSLEQFFIEKLDDLDCENEIVKSYIVSILIGYKSSKNDLSKNSITLLYAEAKNKQDFIKFEKLGGWIFYLRSIFPEYLNDASDEFYTSIGQLSFYSCYRLINKQMPLFEIFADQFVELSENTREIILK